MSQFSRDRPVASSQDLAAFILSLHADLVAGSPWENADLPSYLEALAAWVSEMPGYFESRDEAAPKHPTWELFAQMLAAAVGYE